MRSANAVRLSTRLQAPVMLSPIPTAAVTVDQPQRPAWPVNEMSQPAHVTWDGSQLAVTATNASLSQVLHEVSTATGLHVEGLDPARDQRIFGTFGPAPAKDVLNQLLDGAGYNVMIVGDRGAGNPRELLLAVQSPTARRGGRPAMNQAPAVPGEDGEVEPEPEPEPEPPIDQRPPQGGPPPGARPAQQLLQDLRNQQQKLQQQQQQPANPGQNPAVAPPN